MLNILSLPPRVFLSSSIKQINQQCKTLSQKEFLIQTLSKRYFSAENFDENETPLFCLLRKTYNHPFGQLYLRTVGLCTAGGAGIESINCTLDTINKDEPEMIPFALIEGAIIGSGIGFIWGITSPVSFPFKGYSIWSQLRIRIIKHVKD